MLLTVNPVLSVLHVVCSRPSLSDTACFVFTVLCLTLVRFWVVQMCSSVSVGEGSTDRNSA